MRLDPIAILRHGVLSVLRNAGASLRICWPWLVVFGVVFVALFYVVKQSGFGTTPLDPNRGVGTFVLSYLLGFAVYLVGFCSIAVNWHRYILLDEHPGPRRRLRLDGHVLRYLWRAFLAGLLILAIMIIPMFILSFAAGNLLPSMVAEAEGVAKPTLSLYVFIWVVGAVILTFVTALLFRFGLALPAAALGRYDIGLFDSWRRTGGQFAALLLIAGGSVVMNFVAGLCIDGITSVMMLAGPVAGTASWIFFTVISLWFFTFLGITLLTTLYGHMVEGRPL